MISTTVEGKNSHTCAPRRLMHEQEAKVKHNYFTQIMDIDIYLEGNQTQKLPNMVDYPVRSVENAVEYLSQLLDTGIKAVVIRLGGNPFIKSQEGYRYEPLLVGTNTETIHETDETIYQLWFWCKNYSLET